MIHSISISPTSIRFSSTPPRRKPRPGDRRFTKTWGWQIRRQQVYRYPNGQIEGYCVRNGRPRYEWVRESDLEARELAELRSLGRNYGGLNPAP